MNAAELYLIEECEISNQFFEHYKEGMFASCINDIAEWKYDPTFVLEKLEFRIYKDFMFDARRGWKLMSLWYEGKPFMVAQLAGREYDDYRQYVITNQQRYEECSKYVYSNLLKFIDFNDSCKTVEYDKNEDVTEFYGSKLYGHFERYS